VRVSFVVPLFNCLPLTQAMIDSLQASVPPRLDCEIILVDDGSTDGTREWLAKLGPPFRVILNETNLGYAKANNRGAAAATGGRLCFLNNDLILAPGWFEPMARIQEKLGTSAGLIGNVQYDARTGQVDHTGIFINHQGKPQHCRRRRLWPWRLVRPARRVPALTGACFLTSRALWRQLGGFDEGYLNGCEDVDLCFRAADAGKVNAVALTSAVRHHISAAAGRKRRDEANTYRLVQRWRPKLVELGRPDWCRHHFETYLPEPRDFPDPALARQVALYLAGLRASPPEGSVAGVHQAIDIEIARWKEMGL
jgi:GT2 family glycosyltransferase